MRVIKIAFSAALCMILLNCSNNSDKSDSADSQTETPAQKAEPEVYETPEISIAELRKNSRDPESFFLVDVRTQQEYDAGHLAFTDALIPYDQIDKHLDQLPEDKNATLYMFCRTSRRSGIATDYLHSIGYTNVFNVTGGITAWQQSGYEVVTDE
ncbi:MAG: rhodanese-like domain-containing protein [Calditrichaeota bacterium]|nr:MAG: rhodanese-like domain-containing protein [Calditrichota bacterium]